MKLQSIFRWPRFTRMPLALEITLVLIIKLAIIFLLWKTFFSKPQAKKMLVPLPQMEQHLLSGTVGAVGSATTPDTVPVLEQAKQTKLSPPHLRQEEKHGSN